MGRHYEADVSLAPRQISRGPHALSNCNNEVTQKMRLSSGLGLPPMPNFPFVQGLYRYSRQLDEGLSLSPNQPKPPPSKRCVNSIAASKRLATAPWPLQEPLAEEPEKKKKAMVTLAMRRENCDGRNFASSFAETDGGRGVETTARRCMTSCSWVDAWTRSWDELIRLCA